MKLHAKTEWADYTDTDRPVFGKLACRIGVRKADYIWPDGKSFVEQDQFVENSL
jgi:hypothetical protein